MTPPLTQEQIRSLARLDTCTIANTIGEFNVRLPNEGFCDGSVHCMLPSLPPIAGYAVTGKIRSSVPPAVGHSYHYRPEWWDFILRMAGPRIVVLQDMDSRPGCGSFVGEIHANILQALGCVGYITNGAVRNLPAVEAIGFQMFAGNVTVSRAFAHLLSFGDPIEIGGLKVHTGDLLHADRHGVLSIPQEIAAEIPQAAARLTVLERKVIEFCKSQDFSLGGLRQVIKALK